jgi:hypothetical protein
MSKEQIMNSERFQYDAPIPKPSVEETKEATAREQLSKAYFDQTAKQDRPMNQKIAQFVADTKLDFKYIGHEQFRVYLFPEGPVMVDQPLYLNVNERNNHRIITRKGTSVYIPFKWLALEWQVQEGHPFFAF